MWSAAPATGAGCTHCVRHEDMSGELRSLSRWTDHAIPTLRGLGGTQKRSGRGRTEKSVAPAGMRNQNWSGHCTN
jgi:hypothetical protein